MPLRDEVSDEVLVAVVTIHDEQRRICGVRAVAAHVHDALVRERTRTHEIGEGRRVGHGGHLGERHHREVDLVLLVTRDLGARRGDACEVERARSFSGRAYGESEQRERPPVGFTHGAGDATGHEFVAAADELVFGEDVEWVASVCATRVGCDNRRFGRSLNMVVGHRSLPRSRPSMMADSATTSAAGGRHVKTPKGVSSSPRGVSAPAMPRT